MKTLDEMFDEIEKSYKERKQKILKEAIELLEENGYVVLIEERNNIELSNKWKKHTGLPMNIWIDETATYKKGKHSKRIKFQLNTSEKLQPNNLGVMDLDGKLRTELPLKCSLSNKQLDELRNFIENNREALELVADMKISLDDIFSYMIKGGKKGTKEDINNLHKRIEKLIGKK